MAPSERAPTTLATTAGAPSYDIDGQPRPDPTSGKVDIGADEVE